MNPIIKVENLSKQYRIGQREPYKTFRDAVTDAVAAPFRWLSRNSPFAIRHSPSEGSPFAVRNLQSEYIWALKDVSFEVKPGEVVGIIGRNGAGKSTLLKILSRITEPTTGQVDLYGRVGSLLEVGTGFHPELTGRENIYLNGTILGMKKAEIERRFDEIVAFAELEKFLDTPVKRYSSGMYVRLAFAVAAHLEPEILLVDEVLAVGDAAFQKKCLGKMEEVGSHGRSVLFVSHSMPMVLRLCRRVILLDRGKLIADGASDQIVGCYLSSGLGSCSERVWSTVRDAPGDSVARLHAVRVQNEQGRLVETVDIREPVLVQVEYWSLQHSMRPTAILQFMNEYGVCLFATNEFTSPAWQDKPVIPGLFRATCQIPGNFLAEGRIFVLLAVGTYNPNVVHAIERDAVSFQVVDRSEGDGVRGAYEGEWPGVVRPMLNWEIEYDCQYHQEGLQQISQAT